MTDRESQILSWIAENPLISQQELAVKAGITRSSVAVHISNLMRKGYIRGKGYIIDHEKGIVVVGAVNMDIHGKPNHAIIKKDSNPGVIKYSFGGVGRNIAHNLSLLTTDIKLITIFGDDNSGAQILKSCKELNIDTSWCQQISDGNTSTYLFITDENGEMMLAVSDMEIYNKITPEFIESRMSLINNQSLCICDTNIPQETLAYILEHATCPVFIDPVSTAKAEKLKGVLSKIHTLKPNILEVQLLTGIEIKGLTDVKLAAEKLLSLGIKQIFISMGTEGVYAADNKEQYYLPCFDAKVVNTTGAGDSFMAGIAWAYQQGYSLKNQALAGLAASSICVASSDTVSTDITPQAIYKYMNIEEI